MAKHKEQKAKKSFVYLDFLNILPQKAISLTSWCTVQPPAKKCVAVKGCTVQKKPGEGSEISYQGLLINVLSICWPPDSDCTLKWSQREKRGEKTL